MHLRVVETREFLREIETGEVGQAELTGVVLDNGTVDRRRDCRRHVEVNLTEYAGLLRRACPAGGYEYVEAEVCVFFWLLERPFRME